MTSLSQPWQRDSARQSDLRIACTNCSNALPAAPAPVPCVAATCSGDARGPNSGSTARRAYRRRVPLTSADALRGGGRATAASYDSVQHLRAPLRAALPRPCAKKRPQAPVRTQALALARGPAGPSATPGNLTIGNSRPLINAKTYISDYRCKTYPFRIINSARLTPALAIPCREADDHTPARSGARDRIPCERIQTPIDRRALMWRDTLTCPATRFIKTPSPTLLRRWSTWRVRIHD